MALDLIRASYNPDVLSCLANLSNDEVFTPPEVVNQMLDMLPQELFSNPDTTFLDPATKSGVFLREIAKRLLKGLERQIPDVQERVDHIFKKQLFGIAMTELTSLLARRSVYCSKYPNSSFSVTKFETSEGHIRFRRVNHSWSGGKCIFCGASQSEYDRAEGLETHAYEWIHTNDLKGLFPNMKFDVIISNPPYQLGTAGDNAQAKPIYDKFVTQAIKLQPRYLSMIIPARWYAGGWGLDSFRDKLLSTPNMSVLHDFPHTSDCFPGINIRGGVCYFLWERDKTSHDCTVVNHFENQTNTVVRPLLEPGEDTFYRYNKAISIYNKVKAFHEPTMIDYASSQKPFGFPTNYSGAETSCHSWSAHYWWS